MTTLKQKNLKKRIINFIKTISMEDLYFLFEYGLPHREGTIIQLRQKRFKNIEGPVFFLSTGRCGTKWFARHLSKDRHFKVFHEPWPNFGEASIMAYHLMKFGNGNLDNIKKRLFKEIIIAGRRNPIRFCYKTDRCYVETNHYITFLAPILFDLFPNVKFVHVHRHPAEVVRSAIRRGWYEFSDPVLLTPLPEDIAHDIWHNYTAIEKNAWLWNATNRFIEEFKSTLPADKFITFNFNELNLGNILRLDEFIGASIPERKIIKMLGHKENAQVKGKFKKYDDWSTQQKSQLKKQCAELALRYGYQL